VTCNGSSAPRPRNEYTPQATPATSISNAPGGGGDERPGIISPASPAHASSNPHSCGDRIRSPIHKPRASIVACTAPNSSKAPVAAVSCR
jgi:hypothetical protein